MRQDPNSERENRTARARASGSVPDARDVSMPALTSLSDMDDYEIADDEPDIRGWDVMSSDGVKLGEVDDLIVDTQAMKVRYVEMKLDDSLAADDDHRHAVLPIGAAQLDEDENTVIMSLRTADLGRLPPYVRGNLTREHERSLMERLALSSEGSAVSLHDSADFYNHSSFDDRRPFESRRTRSDRTDSADAQYLRRLADDEGRVDAGSGGSNVRAETERLRSRGRDT